MILDGAIRFSTSMSGSQSQLFIKITGIASEKELLSCYLPAPSHCLRNKRHRPKDYLVAAGVVLLRQGSDGGSPCPAGVGGIQVHREGQNLTEASGR